MSDKSYTVLLTSNSSTKVKSITIPKAWLNAIIFLMGLFLLISLCVLFDYVKILSTHNKSEALLSENLILKQKFSLVENKLLQVEKKLKRVSSISEKIDKLNESLTPHSKKFLPETQRNILASKSKNNIPMGPLQAQLSPMESFFNKLNFLKKAPLEDLLQNSDTKNKVQNVEDRVFSVVKNSDLQEVNALDNWELISRKKNIFDSTPNIKPVRNGWFTSKFGLRKDPFTGHSTMHSGLDIAAAPGSPIYSPANGVVSYVGFESGYGNLVTVDHGYGVKTRYAHSSEVFVKYGQRVRRGEKIAAVGNTGRSSGYHLHYEVRVNGIAVDPKKYINEF